MKVLQAGFDVEVDVWRKNQKWFLGHNRAQYQVCDKFLALPGLWCHAKNHPALFKMILKRNIHCFWHQEDDYTITSRGYLWAYPGKKDGPHSVVVCLGRGSRLLKTAFGLCTDHPLWWERKLRP